MIANLDSSPVRTLRANVVDTWRIPAWGEVADVAMPPWLVEAMMQYRAHLTELGSFRFENDDAADDILLLSRDETHVLRLKRA
ncbi:MULTISPECIES: hypothetical protein [Methylobacterium]|uniref:Uncharacterized protein n=2 Tax=Methylobacterium TaxID=407 RepID=A0A8H8X0D4_9HYPH|nr:hypothetical protein [Methylobacterium indicum]BCM87734.1 hypothetical protein mvi_61950 [Methylobacterium indicum]